MHHFLLVVCIVVTTSPTYYIFLPYVTVCYVERSLSLVTQNPRPRTISYSSLDSF